MSDTSVVDEVQEMMDSKAITAKENQTFLSEFIEIYQAYPCLWKYNCRDYRNRNVKENAYRELVEKMREVDPRADKSSVIRKINVLRTAFRREYKKAKKYGVQKASKGINKSKKKYETTLWYFDLMKFVVEDQEYPDADIDIDEMNDWIHESSASLDEEAKIVDHNTESLMEFLEDTTHAKVKIEASSPTSSRVASPAMNPATINSCTAMQLEINDVYSEKNNQPILPTLRRDEPIISLQEPPPLAPISRPRRQLPVQAQQVVPLQQQPQLVQTQAHTSPTSSQQPQQQSPVALQSPIALQSPQQQQPQLQAHSLQQIQQHIQVHQVDVEHADFDRFGTYVAAKLKRSTRKQSIIAEKVIAEVLMRANLGTLEETTRLTESKV